MDKSEMPLRTAIAFCSAFVDGRPVNGGPVVYQAVHRVIQEITTKPAESTKRYGVVEESQSGHCCFAATVVDTAKPRLLNGEHYKNQFEQVCECFDIESARMICNALNQSGE